MFLPYQEIKRLSLNPDIKLIDPFSEKTEFEGVSYGCGPSSYDLRIDRDITLYPGSSVRADALEKIHMPPYLAGLIVSKSTWAREHIEHAGTKVDPGFGWGFKGILRLEINMHHGHKPIHIKEGAGICQIIFGPLVEICLDGLVRVVNTEKPYEGKYQDQGPNQDAIFRVMV